LAAASRPSLWPQCCGSSLVGSPRHNRSRRPRRSPRCSLGRRSRCRRPRHRPHCRRFVDRSQSREGKGTRDSRSHEGVRGTTYHSRQHLKKNSHAGSGHIHVQTTFRFSAVPMQVQTMSTTGSDLRKTFKDVSWTYYSAKKNRRFKHQSITISLHHPAKKEQV